MANKKQAGSKPDGAKQSQPLKGFQPRASNLSFGKLNRPGHAAPRTPPKKP